MPVVQRTVSVPDIQDAGYQSSLNLVETHWHGFHDLESGIVGYSWCVGLSAQPDECDVKPFVNVGLHTTASIVLNTPFVNGEKYCTLCF